MSDSVSNKYLIVLLVVLSFFPLFVALDFLPVRLFDESRLAVNALEMSRDYDLLVTHYKGEPDMWNVKPPFMIWCQVFCIYLLGAGELALRIPSALAGFLTILLVYYFVKKVTGQGLFGFVSALILASSSGFITEHGTRSGDYDAMLVFFLFFYTACFFLFLKNTTAQKYWYLTCLGVVMAIFTKGIAGLMLIPALFIFTAVSGNLQALIKRKHFWFGVLSIIISVAGYYALREAFNPGYVKKVYENEIFYRYFDVNEGHEGPWNFYILYLINVAYTYWYPFALAGLLTVFMVKDKGIRELLLFVFLNAISFLIVISYSKTKIEWYALPLFPFMAVLAGAFFWYTYHLVSDKLSSAIRNVRWLVPVVFVLLFSFNYVVTVRNSLHPQELPGAYNIYNLSYVFQKAARGNENLDGMYYCYPPYNAHLHFYTEILKEKGQIITLADPAQLKPGFKVLVGLPDVKEYIHSSYSVEVLREYDHGVQLLLIR